MQEAYLRAFRFRRGFRGGDARPWLLRIVRNVFYSSVRNNRGLEDIGLDQVPQEGAFFESPESMLLVKSQKNVLLRALGEMPTTCREMLVLREMEGLSYKQISSLLEIPEGTVMSRLSRARNQLRHHVKRLARQEKVSDSYADRAGLV